MVVTVSRLGSLESLVNVAVWDINVHSHASFSCLNSKIVELASFNNLTLDMHTSINFPRETFNLKKELCMLYKTDFVTTLRRDAMYL